MIVPKKVTNPFVGWVQDVMPSAYDNSLSYYELLTKVLNVLDETLTASNNANDGLTELQSLYNELKLYVDNYFSDLNIQTEINAKLDAMVLNGTLATIINENIFNELNGKVDTNIIDINALEQSVNNVVEDITDIEQSISDANLIIGDLTELQTEDKTSVVNAINEIMENTVSKNKLIIFGDSWSDPANINSIYPDYLANNLNVTVHNYGKAGAGFVEPETNLFSTQLTQFIADNTYDKTLIKYVLILGGVNDYNNDVAYNIVAGGITNFINSIKEVVATDVRIIFISNCKYPFTVDQSNYWLRVHQLVSSSTGITGNTMINTLNLDGMYGMPLFTSDYFHLNTAGQKLMANNMLAMFNGGDMIYYPDNRTLTDGNVTIAYSCQRIKTLAYVSIAITMNTADTSGTVNTDVNIPYGGDYDNIGGTGIANILYELNVNNNNIAFAFNGTPIANRNYYANIIINLG